MSDLPQFLRELADTLDGCEWNHPLCSAQRCREAAEVIDKLLGVVRDIGSDKTLRTRSVGYHARRVALMCGAVLAELDGTYKQASREAGGEG